MKQVISASRRTDVPAYYGDWFMERVRDGAVGTINPFSGARYTISLALRDVLLFVFWSKNFQPFLSHLESLREMGYRFYFQFTITGHSQVLEPNVPEWRRAVETAHRLAELYSPAAVQWRFDPILFSSAAGPDSVMKMFTDICDGISGATRRCIISYVDYYGKVLRNLEKVALDEGMGFRVPPEDEEKVRKGAARADECFVFDLGESERVDFARELAGVASRHDITVQACCEDYLVNGETVRKAHCVDPEIIERILGREVTLKANPTRKECGCYISRDIGMYDTCPHGCCYCYANMNKDKAEINHNLISRDRGLFALRPGSVREEFPELEPHSEELF